MVRILSSGEIVPDGDPRAAGTPSRSSRGGETTSGLPNAPLPSPPTLRHRGREGATSSSTSGANLREGSAGLASGVRVLRRDSSFLGLPDVELLGTRFQGVHLLVVLGSFFLIGWRGIFVALLVYILATQPQQGGSGGGGGGSGGGGGFS